MSKRDGLGRRGFLGSTLVGAGLAAGGLSRATAAPAEAIGKKGDRLPREVWIASVSHAGLEAATPAAMGQQMRRRMEEIVPMQPDVICLPETFLVSSLTQTAPSATEVAESPIGELLRPFSEFARAHACYVVCPLHTRAADKVYNSAVLLDRAGELVGEYRKAHPTTGEIDSGVAPGPLEPPVFKTDFGIVGMQICFDIEWSETWRSLQQSGAEIVFWPSAFAGGQMVNTKAWQHQYCVVSSTLKDTTKICDVTGEELARTSRWNQWVCAPVNLEKAFLHTWPYVHRFDEIQAKYGRKIRIRNFAEEEWSILESRSADLKIADVLREFDLLTLAEHLKTADNQQCRCR